MLRLGAKKRLENHQQVVQFYETARTILLQGKSTYQQSFSDPRWLQHRYRDREGIYRCYEETPEVVAEELRDLLAESYPHWNVSVSETESRVDDKVVEKGLLLMISVRGVTS